MLLLLLFPCGNEIVEKQGTFTIDCIAVAWYD